MIGQKALLDRIRGQVEREKFPRFSIFIGEKGSGKKTLAYEVASMMGISTVVVGTNVDSIRTCIEDSYKYGEKIIYIVADCDTMSSAAANALLKVTEEPPKQAYFILTCENVENLLATLKSRGVTYMLSPYSYDDKCDYIEGEDTAVLSDEDIGFMLNVASNIGELKTLISMNIKEFKEYVNLVIDNILEVSDSNAFKIGEKIALKDEPDKYNLPLFWKAFTELCSIRMKENEQTAFKYSQIISITEYYVPQVQIKGLNKQMLFDKWIIDLREECE